MSTIEKINQLSHRIFNTTLTEKTVARTSNPFAKSNFQKNILTEDVFESSNKKTDHTNFTGNITAGTKRIYSTFVGSLTDFGSRIQDGIQAINEFGVRMKDYIVNAWNKVYEIGNKEIHLDGVKNVLNADVTAIFGKSHEKEISRLAKMDPHSEVKPMLSEYLKALENDLVVAA